MNALSTLLVRVQLCVYIRRNLPFSATNIGTFDGRHVVAAGQVTPYKTTVTYFIS